MHFYILNNAQMSIFPLLALVMMLFLMCSSVHWWVITKTFNMRKYLAVCLTVHLRLTVPLCDLVSSSSAIF